MERKKNQWQIHEGHSRTFTFNTPKEGLKHSAVVLCFRPEGKKQAHRGENKNVPVGQQSLGHGRMNF